MTIDLGFAWIDLPGGAQLGVNRRAGPPRLHREYAGPGGGDRPALFVVAADEGVMPQTREHCRSLDLLGIPGGVIALTKTDMVDDPEWLEPSRSELRETVQGTVLPTRPILPVSARAGMGLDALKTALEAFLTALPPRIDQGHPRLPIDRVFHHQRLWHGGDRDSERRRPQVGDAIELQPEGIPAGCGGCRRTKPN
jgi:selenocysteine-specific elongation factor